jgi:2-polyprenyl-3-methyl-5-hydroxy-6-metoxy-1,4-benzoquinol methylase
MGGYWRRQVKEFQNFRRQMPGSTYRDWQPTKWQSLQLLGTAVRDYALAAGRPVRSAVELGCGSATLLCQLAAEGIDCAGVDLDKNALTLAQAAIESMPSPPRGRMRLRHGNFMDREALTLGPADMSFSIGVIEHYAGAAQLDVLRRHFELSKHWVLVAVPNIASPLFETFLRAMAADGALYDEDHVAIDVPALSVQAGARVVLSDGCHLFLSRSRDYRFADDELREFQHRLRPELLSHGPRYYAYPDIDMTSADIGALSCVEAAASRADRLRFGFLLWYLITCEAT